MRKTVFELFVAFLAFWSLSAMASPDIAVIDLAKGSKAHPPYSDLRQVVVHIDDGAKTFMTIARKGNGVLLRKIDLRGTVLSETHLPAFQRGYAGSPRSLL